MANNEKMLRGNTTVLAIYPEGIANPQRPTSAELNAQFKYATNTAAMAFNISCAITDDSFTANVADSDTDDTRTICQVSQTQNPTFQNYEVSFDVLRDEDLMAQGVFNLAFELFIAPDRPFWIVTRQGEISTEPFRVGQDIKMFGVTTDNPVDVVDDNSMLKFGPRFKNTGELLVNYRLES